MFYHIRLPDKKYSEMINCRFLTNQDYLEYFPRSRLSALSLKLF